MDKHPKEYRFKKEKMGRIFTYTQTEKEEERGGETSQVKNCVFVLVYPFFVIYTTVQNSGDSARRNFFFLV